MKLHEIDLCDSFALATKVLLCQTQTGELFRARFKREVTLTEIFPTYHAGLKIPDYIVDSHRKTWSQIAFAGEFWSDIDRVEIAKQARAPGPAWNFSSTASIMNHIFRDKC